MQRERKVFWGKTAAIFSALPLLMWAYEFGPDAGVSGVPGENGTCAQARCHVGTANDPKNTGSVSVAFPNGQSYTPGVKQHLVVTIADPAQRAWGFQLTAREAGSTGTMAGALISTDANTTMMCATANLGGQKEVPFSASGNQACPANLPLAYIEHSLAGYNASRGHTGSATYEFDWTPPASAVGNITIYVAGNAANGDLTQNGDHIYTTTYTLTPADAGGGTGSTPSIGAGGVVSAAAYGGFTAIAPGTWIEIYGTGFSTTTREWAGSDFKGNTAPTSLDGVKVSIGGKAAFVRFISSGQVNVQVPSDVPLGPQQMTVSNVNGTSGTYNVTVNPVEPGLLAPPSFNIGGKQYAVALTLDGKYVLPAGAIAGLTSRPAKPGETIIMYGIGFGPVKDGSNASIPAGQIVTAANQLTNAMEMQIGGAAAQLAYAGLGPNFVGLYQFNVVVPAIADNNAAPVAYTLAGSAGGQTVYLAVHQ